MTPDDFTYSLKFKHATEDTFNLTLEDGTIYGLASIQAPKDKIRERIRALYRALGEYLGEDA